jgi:hypothetical protein
MPYPNLCPGGYPMPEKEGRFEVIGIRVSPTVDGAPTEVILRDHWDLSAPRQYDPSNEKYIVFRSQADMETGFFFEAPFKTICGLRAHTLSPNTEVYVYIR